jgi:gas vesicle protein
MENIMMNGSNQLLEKPEENTSLITEQQSNNYGLEDTENGFAKVAIATLIGASVGAVAGILALKGSAQKINQSAKTIGDVIKSAVEGINQTVKSATDTIKTAADGINETVKDVGNTVKTSAVNANDSIKDTVDTVKNTAVNVNDTVKNAMHIVKGAASGVSETVQDTVDVAQKVVENDDEKKSASNGSTNVPEHQRTYILVPVDEE